MTGRAVGGAGAVSAAASEGAPGSVAVGVSEGGQRSPWHGDAPDVDRIFAALADPTRRLVLDVLGQLRECSATTIAQRTPVSRQAVVKHLVILDKAGLVAGHRVGREVLFRVRPEGLRTAATWMTDLASVWDQRLRRLKEEAESAPGGISPDGAA
jgi:DNA-binding transcriptional ArsR family regulator